MLGRVMLHDLLEDEDTYDSEEFEEELQDIYMLVDLEQMAAASDEAVLAWDRLRRKDRAQPRPARYSHGALPGASYYVQRRARIHPDWERYIDPDLADCPEDALYKEFRKKFRVPIELFHTIVARARLAAGPDTWPDDTRGSKPGPKPVPLSLKILCVLRVLALGVPFDTCREWGVAPNTANSFFNVFVPWFVEHIYPEEVRIPRTVEEMVKHMEVFSKCGFVGCILSHDGVHLAWDRAPVLTYHDHRGKEGYPTVAYNVCVSHALEIFSVTQGFPGSTNDKTMVRYDPFINALDDNPLFKDFEYDLRYRCPETKNLLTRKEKGVYAINDGGYHRWPETISGYRHQTCVWKARFSERLESTRKDSERVFGILKKRFRILRLPFLQTNREQIDHIFMMCCALHNMILRFDGRDGMGEEDADWITADIEQDDLRIRQSSVISCGGVSRPLTADTDFTSTGFVAAPSDLPEDLSETDKTRAEQFNSRRLRLVENYKVMWENRDILWLNKAQNVRPRAS